MTIEVAIVISAISVAFGIYQGLANLKRFQKLDDKNETTQLTTVIVKLETISTGITDIKNEIKNVKDDMRDHRDRIVILEQAKHANDKRMDTCEKHCSLRRVGDPHESE